MIFDALRSDYARLWNEVQIHSHREQQVKTAVRTLVRNKSRYKAVAQNTGVPWFVIGIIHIMESDADFTKHLHNGDPLTARTRNVPRGRPKIGTPPFGWEESAVDALLQKGLDKITDWSVERIAFELERYNGFGYRRYHPTTLSPYLWAGTAHYARGKYIADGRWSSSAVSRQVGGMAILLRLLDQPEDIPIRRPTPPTTPTPTVEPKGKASELKINPPAAGAFGALGGALAAIATQVDAYLPWVILVLVVVAVGFAIAITWDYISDLISGR